MGEGPSSYLDVTINSNEIPSAVASIAFSVPTIATNEIEEKSEQDARDAALVRLRQTVEDNGNA
jgi:hypothetical protein